MLKHKFNRDRIHITFFISQVSLMRKYLAKPRRSYWEVVKGMLLYLGRTLVVELLYGKHKSNEQCVKGLFGTVYVENEIWEFGAKL
ncbi:hypothetical protein TIFTF001_041594 [Ficus carica]|uniref:Reverse transcriptase Ty1/copia-type domain-containing protein n=1 Tax=Ficus carica TaxID=3494 RepID=A0AA87ZR01_FICCA|nr:hypothetical protein TIFTF001_041594 [Ficus carica]